MRRVQVSVFLCHRCTCSARVQLAGITGPLPEASLQEGHQASCPRAARNWPRQARIEGHEDDSSRDDVFHPGQVGALTAPAHPFPRQHTTCRVVHSVDIMEPLITNRENPAWLCYKKHVELLHFVLRHEVCAETGPAQVEALVDESSMNPSARSPSGRTAPTKSPRCTCFMSLAVHFPSSGLGAHTGACPGNPSYRYLSTFSRAPTT